ncbi:MAG: SAM-dependent methyltransferase [Acidimicrobiales bacterium]
MSEDFWDERYRSASRLWSGDPNPQLVTEAADLTPGRALDVGCGEGADAIWLAERGWLVTAVDISTVALARGAAHSAEVGVLVAQRITWLHADLTTWTPEVGDYDLVSMQFMHLPPERRDSLLRRLAASVAPAGSLLIVGHHPSDLQTTARRPRTPELLFTAADAAAPLDSDQWRIAVSAARARTITDPEGQSIGVHDTVLRAERRP